MPLDTTILTPAEELALYARWRAGDARAADRLIESNQRLLWRLARKYTRGKAAAEDLVQEGNIGLMHALERFDPARGIRFMSYASWWARAYMQEFARKEPSVVRMPARGPGRRFRPYAANDASLDVPAFDGGKRTRAEELVDDAPSAESTTVARDEDDRVLVALRSLGRREREILTLRFLASEPWTLQRIGFRLHVTRERVRQIEEVALQKLKKRLAA